MTRQLTTPNARIMATWPFLDLPRGLLLGAAGLPESFLRQVWKMLACGSQFIGKRLNWRMTLALLRKRARGRQFIRLATTARRK